MVAVPGAIRETRSPVEVSTPNSPWPTAESVWSDTLVLANLAISYLSFSDV
jgi:hypothetical protein